MRPTLTASDGARDPAKAARAGRCQLERGPVGSLARSRVSAVTSERPVGTAPGLSVAPAAFAVAAGSFDTGLEGFAAGAGLEAAGFAEAGVAGFDVDATGVVGFAAAGVAGFDVDATGVVGFAVAGVAGFDVDGFDATEVAGVAGDGFDAAGADALDAGFTAAGAAAFDAAGVAGFDADGFDATEVAGFDATAVAGFDATGGAVLDATGLAGFPATGLGGVAALRGFAAVRFAAAFLRGVARPVGTDPAFAVAAAPFAADAGVFRAVADFGPPGAPGFRGPAPGVREVGGTSVSPSPPRSRPAAPSVADSALRPSPIAESIRFPGVGGIRAVCP
jgi:hypothetical protein